MINIKRGNMLVASLLGGASLLSLLGCSIPEKISEQEQVLKSCLKNRRIDLKNILRATSMRSYVFKWLVAVFELIRSGVNYSAVS